MRVLSSTMVIKIGVQIAIYVAFYGVGSYILLRRNPGAPDWIRLILIWGQSLGAPLYLLPGDPGAPEWHVS